MTRTSGGKALAAAVAAIVALSGCGVSFQTLPQLGSGSASGYPIHAVFSNVQDLAINAKVRYGDAVVGHVTSITAQRFQADLTMRIERGQRLPAGTTAKVLFETPLGDEYVQLSPPPTPAGAALTAGATIGPAATTAAPTVADTLAALGAVLYGSGLGQARTVITSLNQILGDNHQPIQQLLAHLDTVLGSLSANDGHIDAALGAASHLVSEINTGQSAVTEALDTLPPAAASVAADNQQIRQLLSGINRLSPIVTNVLAQSGQNLVADVSQAVPVLQSLASVDAKFGSDSEDFVKFADAAQRDIPNDYVHLNVSFTANLPSAEPIPQLAPLLGCTQPTPPSQCPPGTSLVDLISGALP